MSAALAERSHEIDRTRIGPLQVLEDENERLHVCAGQDPGGERRQLPVANLIGRKSRQAFRWNRNVGQRRKQGSILRRTEPHLREGRFHFR